MKEMIRQKLLELADEDYQKFSARLLPNIDNVIGVRLPLLRKLARKIAQGDWRRYMATAASEYFEEIMLQGMVIGYVKTDIEEILSYVADFIPKIDNWSVCDSFCTGLKFTNDYKERVWQFLQPYLISRQEYEIRFSVVMLLKFYIDDEYTDRVLELLDNIKHEGYYAKMAVAWAVSICFVKLPQPTMAYLKNNTLDDFTYNKALQKITESYQVDKETKDLIRSMKRK
jgi:3-methyladenine DNA glycosylase AlkD